MVLAKYSTYENYRRPAPERIVARADTLSPYQRRTDLLRNVGTINSISTQNVFRQEGNRIGANPQSQTLQDRVSHERVACETKWKRRVLATPTPLSTEPKRNHLSANLRQVVSQVLERCTTSFAVQENLKFTQASRQAGGCSMNLSCTRKPLLIFGVMFSNAPLVIRNLLARREGLLKTSSRLTPHCNVSRSQGLLQTL
ncbi:hypothetical protein VTI74DRAFT_8268 [Chaetomium olivicolor]